MNPLKVVITEAAVADLISIGLYIRRDNPSRAVSFVAELEAKCKELGTMPKSFPFVPRHRESGVRRRPHGNYLIFYRLGADCVEVLHILHGARDYEAILFPDAN